MRRWISRMVPALLLGVSLPAAVGAQEVLQPPATPPPPVAPGTPLPPAEVAVPVPVPPQPGPAGAVPNEPGVPPVAAPAVPVPPVVVLDPYHAATPYNPTVVGRPVPNPAYNRPIMTLPCVNPNQNFEPLQLSPSEWLGHILGHGKCGGGCGGGAACGDGGCGDGACGGKHGLVRMSGHGTDEDCGCGDPLKKTGFGWMRGRGCCTKPGSCATCCNTSNFIWGSSRSFFGESSREFFERPPAIDGIKEVPHKYGQPRGYVPPAGAPVLVAPDAP
jgi:hypothetical protein